jgi:hypothetical protein
MMMKEGITKERTDISVSKEEKKKESSSFFFSINTNDDPMYFATFHIIVTRPTIQQCEFSLVIPRVNMMMGRLSNIYTFENFNNKYKEEEEEKEK